MLVILRERCMKLLTYQCHTCILPGAARCSGAKGLSSGSYEIVQFCLEPDAFFVREEGKKEFDPSKVLTRQTYTLDMVSGTSRHTIIALLASTTV
jgi:hypothetical protein